MGTDSGVGTTEPTRHDIGARPSWLPEVLSDRYILERRLATGLHGPSWLLQDCATGRQVVLRYVAAGSVPGPLFAGLVREATSLADTCPASARVIDVHEDGSAVWLIREWIAGENLTEALATLGRLTPSQAHLIVDGACQGLVTRSGDLTVHGHLSPENVVIRPDGTVSLADYGLRLAGARILRPQPIPYLAPEVILGDLPSRRSDVYAIGALLYVSVCGRYPLAFSAGSEANTAILTEHRICAPPAGANLSGRLGQVIWRALQPRPGDRFASAAEFRTALHGAIPGASPGVSERTGPRGRLSRWAGLARGR